MRSVERAFTLVELLVVIGVIAILIAILMPVAARARQAAITVTCLSNQRQLGQALLVYATANHNIISYKYETSVGVTDGGKYWHWFLAQEQGLRSAVAGPYRKVGNTVTPPLMGESGGTALKCPRNARWYGQGAFNGVSYAMMQYSPGTNGAFRRTYSSPTYHFLGQRLLAVKDTTSVILAIDSATGGVSLPVLMRTYDDGVMPGIFVNRLGEGNRGGTLDRVWLAHPNDKANVLFLDGHVETRDKASIRDAGVTRYFDTKGALAP